jgi:hypothetical protein
MAQAKAEDGTYVYGSSWECTMDVDTEVELNEAYGEDFLADFREGGALAGAEGKPGM